MKQEAETPIELGDTERLVFTLSTDNQIQYKCSNDRDPLYNSAKFSVKKERYTAHSILHTSLAEQSFSVITFNNIFRGNWSVPEDAKILAVEISMQAGIMINVVGSGASNDERHLTAPHSASSISCLLFSRRSCCDRKLQ
ncbi:hypothetical protein J6590_030525 [Homalodisca vitripennis]|nr:hypothetical protein J6590_030525 [Homalodisca vitripennis]